MCSVSKIDEMLKATASSAAASPEVSHVSAVQLKHSREKYFLVDIREAEEISSKPSPVTVDAEMPMGKLLHVAPTNDLDEWKKNRNVVLLCSSGRRASMAASDLSRYGFGSVAVLSHGIVGLENPAAIIPDTLVVLGIKDHAEKLTLALNACAVAASQGETVVLALISDGICTFLRKGSNKDAAEKSFKVTEVFVGEPFQPCHALLNKFLATGTGVVLACTSCAKHRAIEFGSDLLDFVQPMQMPDLLRMLGEAKKTLQFL
jgi:rhodanese-related sulfurtransferase